ncbi:MAG: hypothetical protein CMA63_06665 [Euryarchaeota archaeon]|nr:hypothetical protein [Euryarchaeota archaeon]
MRDRNDDYEDTIMLTTPSERHLVKALYAYFCRHVSDEMTWTIASELFPLCDQFMMDACCADADEENGFGVSFTKSVADLCKQVCWKAMSAHSMGMMDDYRISDIQRVFAEACDLSSEMKDEMKRRAS